jgi:hypothetical protein
MARDTRLDRTIAVKILPSHAATNPEGGRRFEGETLTQKARSAVAPPLTLVTNWTGELGGK